MRYTIEGTSGNAKGEATETVIWDSAKTEKIALSKANRILRKKGIVSVWVQSYSDDEDDIDFINQWNKYKGELNFRKTSNA